VAQDCSLNRWEDPLPPAGGWPGCPLTARSTAAVAASIGGETESQRCRRDKGRRSPARWPRPGRGLRPGATDRARNALGRGFEQPPPRACRQGAQGPLAEDEDHVSEAAGYFSRITAAASNASPALWPFPRSTRIRPAAGKPPISLKILWTAAATPAPSALHRVPLHRSLVPPNSRASSARASAQVRIGSAQSSSSRRPRIIHEWHTNVHESALRPADRPFSAGGQASCRAGIPRTARLAGRLALPVCSATPPALFPFVPIRAHLVGSIQVPAIMPFAVPARRLPSQPLRCGTAKNEHVRRADLREQRLTLLIQPDQGFVPGTMINGNGAPAQLGADARRESFETASFAANRAARCRCGCL